MLLFAVEFELVVELDSMEELVVWRGYNGHVYFSPIQVQQFETDRIISPTTKPRKSIARTIATSAKILERSRTVLSAYRNKKSAPYKTSTSKNKSTSEHSGTNQKPFARTTSDETQLRNNTLATFIEGEENSEENNGENKEQHGKMWRSVVTCAPVQIKPISKRSQYAIEELQAFQLEQTLQDSTGYTRQVLPNIRPIPKSKFVYKGLAYKEAKKIPGINHEIHDDHNTDPFKKPLIDYNLAQAYVRYEINAERAKHIPRHLPSSTIMTTTSTMTTTTNVAAARFHAKDQQLQKTQTSLDLREIRKRIVKGSTLITRPVPQSASWTPGRSDNKSMLGSEVLLYTRSLSTLNHAPTLPSPPLQLAQPAPLLSFSSQLPKQHIIHTTPTLSQHFEDYPVDTIKTISLL
ncbi:unnamed protein product [Rotaria socialis]|uniref:Uncharacterized protein n=2 Tax=Rotaria socialis TaxID=392032 RepID=A0A818LHK2_9BILA|nr:unnamed protein product [Rotaria socialis]